MMATIPLFITSLLASFDQAAESQELLDFAVGAFAILLLFLTISAYRKTRLRRLLIVSVAFALFAVEVAVRQLDVLAVSIGYQNVEVVTSLLDFLILLLFFLAVVVKK